MHSHPPKAHSEPGKTLIVEQSVAKEPDIFLRSWCGDQNVAKKSECFLGGLQINDNVASHLLDV